MTTSNLERAVSLFHALADPIRLRIVEKLRDGERCVCELTDVLDVGQSRLSFHLKTLKDAGLLIDRRQGRWIYYALNPATIGGLQDFVGSIPARRRTTWVSRI